MAKRITASDVERAKACLEGQSLVLIGMMGAGKTSVGRRLAEKLGMKFIDADHEIESAAGKSIPEIFADHGEAYFREGERRVISRLLETSQQVLATGGGAFMNEETRQQVKAKALSVWLKADVDLLLRRVSKRNNRPLLAQGDPRSILENLIRLREPIYAEADITVTSRDAHHSQTVNDVIRAIATRHRSSQEADVED
jgi:shikimate kinase